MIQLILLAVVLILFGLGVAYNKQILKFLGVTSSKADKVLNKMFGYRLGHLQVRFDRKVHLNNKSYYAKVNRYFHDILVNLELEKQGVTVIGLMSFITTASLGAGILFFVWSGEFILGLTMVFATFYLIIVLFRFFSLLRAEKKEALIMDAEDLIAMDVSTGVQNAITRYHGSFHPDIKLYFGEFLDNIQTKGYSFPVAMRMLNEQLGSTFSNFTRKAIMYEEKADDDMVDVFSSIVDMNQKRRELRYQNNKKFEALRLQFLLSTALIVGYGVFSIFTDAFLAHFFTQTYWGKLLVIMDIVLVAGVISYLSAIKSRLI